MFRKVRNRAVLAGLAVTLAASTLAGSQFHPAQAETSFGADRVARAQALALALDAYTGAIRTCDVDAAREAYEHADAILDAIEMDIQFASANRFLFFEGVYMGSQVPASLGLAGEDAGSYTCQERLDLAGEQAAIWAEATGFLVTSPENSPLFNDLATLRTVNQGIRLARAALDGDPEATPQTPATAPDPAGGKAHWLEFVADYPVARELIAFRYETLATEIDGLVAAATTAFEGDPAQGYPGASAALAALASHYDLASRLVTAAAKNHVPTRPTFEPTAWDALDTLEDLVLTFFEIRDLITAGSPQAGAQILAEYDDWLVYPLSLKLGTGPATRADVDLTTAVESYSAEPTEATARALRAELAVAEQVFVGQYWGTPELVQYYAENLAPSAF